MNNDNCLHPPNNLKMTDRCQILKCLDEQSIEFPDFRELLPPLIQLTSPHYATLVEELNRYIDSLFPDDPKKAAKLKYSDLAFLCCQWWPTASWNELSTAAKLTVWILVLDDQLDQEFVLRHDHDAAQDYLNEISRSMRDNLGLSEEKSNSPIKSKLLQRFGELGEVLRACYDAEQMQRLFHELQIILKSLKTEQAIHMQDRLPSYDEYWKVRKGTNLMGAACALIEFVYHILLPQEAMEHNYMKDLWHWTNIVVALYESLYYHGMSLNADEFRTNDILSLQKEVARSEVSSWIPILLQSTSIGIQGTVDIAVQQLQESTLQLNLARKQIKDHFHDIDEVTVFADACYNYCAGFMSWSFMTPRYGKVEGAKNSKGKISVVLHPAPSSHVESN